MDPSTAGSPVRIPPPGSANAFDYIFLLRPMILIPVWTFFLLGARHGHRTSGGSPDPVMLAAGLAIFSALLGAVYVINQITDRRTDLAANKLFLISHSIVSLPSARAMAALLAAAALAAGFLFMSRSFFMILSASFLLGLLYSVEPIRLKKRAVLDIAANAAGDVADAYSYMAEYHVMSGDLPLAINQLELALSVPSITGVQRAKYSARLKEFREAMPKERARMQRPAEPQGLAPNR